LDEYFGLVIPMRPERYMMGPASRGSGEVAVFLMALLLTIGAVIALGWLLFLGAGNVSKKDRFAGAICFAGASVASVMICWLAWECFAYIFRAVEAIYVLCAAGFGIFLIVALVAGLIGCIFAFFKSVAGKGSRENESAAGCGFFLLLGIAALVLSHFTGWGFGKSAGALLSAFLFLSFGSIIILFLVQKKDFVRQPEIERKTRDLINPSPKETGGKLWSMRSHTVTTRTPAVKSPAKSFPTALSWPAPVIRHRP
jgi:hypothetical protein